MKFEQKLISRIFAVLVFSGLSFGLYKANTAPEITKPAIQPRPPEVLKLDLAAIDQSIDSMLVKYGVALKRVRKKKISFPDNDFVRIEREVPVPPKSVMLLMTADFHAMAKRYGGRAIASENLKDNSVTVHIEEEHCIVQSLVLRHAAYLYEAIAKEEARKKNEPPRKPATSKSRKRSHK